MTRELSEIVMRLAGRSSLDFFRDDWAIIVDQIPASDRKLEVEKTVREIASEPSKKERNTLLRILKSELLNLSIWLEGWEAAQAAAYVPGSENDDDDRGRS